MKKTIKGKFETKSTPQPLDDTTSSIGGMRMTFEKRFHGPLDATGLVSMMGIMNRDLSSGGYVAIEKITGKVDGLQGTFCLQHSSVMLRGIPNQSITIIPDTGTEGLTGITGKMTIDIGDGQHYYTFEYELNPAIN
jgi:hypothetical protein